MRYHDWQSRLADVIGRRMAEPFAWGSNDCCLFAADAVLAMTGVDHAAAYRGAYSTASAAANVVSSLGGLAAIAALCGHEIPVMSARVGDVVLGRIDRECLGVCTGETWHAPTSSGLVVAPMSMALKAWRV